MKSIEAGPGAVITSYELKSRGPQGWVARITGLDPKYELKRTFLDCKRRKAWVHYKLAERGLYEYRGIGEDGVAGFFVVDGTLGRRIRPLDRSQALVHARMKDGA